VTLVEGVWLGSNSLCFAAALHMLLSILQGMKSKVLIRTPVALGAWSLCSLSCHYYHRASTLCFEHATHARPPLPRPCPSLHTFYSLSLMVARFSKWEYRPPS
jgi:hypothetical protein